jgi:Fur family ferric uptake transcriptional regulator
LSFLGRALLAGADIARLSTLAMEPTAAYLERVRPVGGKRSSKRDLIVNVFLRQEGHLSADDLVDLIRSEDQKISRATVYRTLQWMVDAGVARKVDFGEGRFRFEHSYRHPRHFHLICKSCNRSSEFLSSDIEGLIEEIALAREFSSRQSVVQIYGTCKECRLGRRPPGDETSTELLFARDALRIAIATERSGREFYSQAASVTRDRRGRTVFEKLAAEEEEHLATLETRYRELLAEDPQLESRPTFLFFKGAANGLFAEGAKQLGAGVDDREALRIGIRCERGSHRFFKRYGEQFDDSEGKRIFLEFADEERSHMEILIREYRALLARGGPSRTVASRARPARMPKSTTGRARKAR